LSDGDFVSCQVSSSNSCSVSTDQDNIQVSAYPNVDLALSVEDPIICKGEGITINTSITNGTNGPYTLTNHSGEIISQNPTYYPTETQAFVFNVTDGCSFATSSIDIEVINSPEATFSSDLRSGCYPLEVNFICNTDEENLIYRWFFDDDLPSISNQQNTSYTYGSEGLYDVSLQLTNDEGCQTTISYADYIQIFPKPEAIFTLDEKVISNLNPEISIRNYSEGARYYLWDLGDSTISYQEEPEHAYQEAGDYTIKLVAVSDHGCIDSMQTKLTLIDAVTFYAPTAFTPGYDYTNDNFVVKGSGIDEDTFVMYIYDRWGEKIFTSNILAEGWDGRMKSGKVVQNGAYTWLVRFVDVSGVQREYSGPVTVIR
jgi:gliding motility-associated-like protein